MVAEPTNRPEPRYGSATIPKLLFVRCYFREVHRTCRPARCATTVFMPQFSRRALTRRQAIAGMAGATALPLAEANSGKLDREAIVKRHNPVLRAPDITSALQVGNGEF